MKPPITDLEFRALAEKCQEGIANEAELKAFEEAYELLSTRHTSWDAALMGEKAAVRNEMYAGLFDQVHDIKRKNKIFSIGRYLSAAAILMIVGISTYFFLNKVNPQDQSVASVIVPGSNTATLTLADGRKINLSDAKNGAILEQTGIQITKSADGRLMYKVQGTEGATAQSLTYNTIETPKGGQYQVILPDGTKVWLNAVSSLRFPMSFASLSERKVELSGEAYFEVEKDKAHPFKVVSDGQEVQVLGTHFNINSYKDEGGIKTTLLEGSVKVTSKGTKQAEVIIKPGEQAILNPEGIEIVKTDVEQVIDWKNGDFIFQHESLKEIMNKIGRWYNVRVIYDKDVDTALTFSAQISRSKDIPEILKSLESTGEVNFDIRGTTIKVRKN
ncbi:FecR family protein [Pedobacter gandavensis]|uniref:FecR family protein n=1 Tax=Pedobacter gandavensis TaxID=2679963 RepID=UPI00292F494B|nr:FecR domain-containing protein [Pedobacter gandavensis]